MKVVDGIEFLEPSDIDWQVIETAKITNHIIALEIARQIVHDAIDNTPMAEDAYPGIKERLHKAVDEVREVTE